jgi:hypothetical protein
VPLDLTVEKLRGFIADHNAEIISVSKNQISIKLNAVCSDGGRRRRADHHIVLRARLTLDEISVDDHVTPSTTNVHIDLHPFRNRDRRDSELAACFAQVMASLKSYLMAEMQKPDQG